MISELAQSGRGVRSRREQAVLLATFLACIALAYSNRFIQDDAFISFRYALNLVQGHGLVWNPGERVEGYTNFLWTLIMALPLLAGYDPVGFSQGLGVILFAGTLATTYALAVRLLEDRQTALLAIVLLGTNYTFSAYATGGLETQLQALLLTLGALLVMRMATDRAARSMDLFLFSGLSALALMTRLDSALPLFVLGAFLLAHVLQATASPSAKARDLALLILPGAAPIAIWLAWKWSYYGDVLPNTFYAKAGEGSSGLLIRYVRGVFYLYSFWLTSALLPCLVLFAFKCRVVLKNARLVLVATVAAVWMLYVARLGGDFMEFRLMVPVLPLIAIVMAATLATIPEICGPFVTMAVVASFLHGLTYGGATGIEPVRGLNQHIESPDQNWRGIGEHLGRVFGHDSNVVIATTAAGAIPFYSGLRSVDMLGLNDKGIIRGGIVISDRPGHEKVATHRQLVERGVNLVIGHPRMVPVGAPPRDHYQLADLKEFWLVGIEKDLLPDDLRVLTIPITRDWQLECLYLKRNEAIERAIVAHNWHVTPVAR